MQRLQNVDVVVPKVQPGSMLSDMLQFKAQALNKRIVPVINSTVGRFTPKYANT